MTINYRLIGDVWKERKLILLGHILRTEPEDPMITRDSPLYKDKLISFKTSLLPNVFDMPFMLRAEFITINFQKTSE